MRSILGQGTNHMLPGVDRFFFFNVIIIILKNKMNKYIFQYTFLGTYPTFAL